MHGTPSDAGSLDGFVCDHYAMVLSFCSALLGDRSEAEDLAQEVFLVACRKLDQFDASRPAGPWLRGIARNLARNIAREKHPLSYLDNEALVWLEEMYSRVEARAGRTGLDKQDALGECLGALPEADREYIRMRYQQGRSYSEISTSLQTSVENVKKRLYRIRRRLADCVLDRLGGANGGTRQDV